MASTQVNEAQNARHVDEQIGNGSAVTSTTKATTTPRVPQPIFTIVNAPLITDVSREALLEWMKLRKEYVAVIEARCKAANEDVKAVLRSVHDSFDSNLLETMCETRWDVDLENVTDEFLMDKIKEITASFKNRELPDMDDLFSDELKFDLTISDVEARVTAYFHLANEIIKRNGVSDLFLGEEGIKRKCKVLVKFLPGPLKKKTKNELEYRSGEAKLAVRKLYSVVSNLALELEKETRAVKKVKAKEAKHNKAFVKERSVKAFNKKTVHAVGVATTGVKRSAGGTPRQGDQRNFSRPTHPKKCFHCEGEHEFIKCPTATEADKAAIREKCRAEYKARLQAGYQQRKQDYSAGFASASHLKEEPFCSKMF
uniref:CCHC-type domain-containing protein n=1 Tax=Phytophthora fragariae TaxID=53985 RepID=A0A6A3FAM7_9STRA|nr:hypothetical protein PF009_g10954 [Phytophthora fragariae]